MPYKIVPESDRFTPSVSLPQNVGHKPVYGLPYQHLDGYRASQSDARYLSVGLAQYREMVSGNDVSVKVMRHTGQQWSPQAEELPLHRAIDATILLAKVLFDEEDGAVRFRAGTFLGQDKDIELTREPRTLQERDDYDKFIANHREELKERLNVLAAVLADLQEDLKPAEPTSIQ